MLNIACSVSAYHEIEIFLVGSCYLTIPYQLQQLRGYIQKFPDWLPGATAANGIDICH
jgi:hypothetical protein